MSASDFENSSGNVGAAGMWYGYLTEAIYVVLGTLLIASVVGILVYA